MDNEYFSFWNVSYMEEVIHSLYWERQGGYFGPITKEHFRWV